MTVGELIRRLMDMPVDATVVVNMRSNELANGGEAGTVELVDAYRMNWAGVPNDLWMVDYEPDDDGDQAYRKAKVVNINYGVK